MFTVELKQQVCTFGVGTFAVQFVDTAVPEFCMMVASICLVRNVNRLNSSSRVATTALEE
jgi:hypothetical protein